jgi:hypothetical protein
VVGVVPGGKALTAAGVICGLQVEWRLIMMSV